jgi:hypothetical protein
VLKPGGKVLVDYPFLQGVHGYPHHYFNATPQGCISLFENDCDIISSTIEPNNHPIHSIWWILMVWRYGLDDADREEFQNLTIGKILETPPDQLLGAAYCKNLSPDARRIIPAGSTLVARKKNDGVAGSRPTSGDVTLMASEPEKDIHLRHRIDALESEVAALRASRSWRLTAPLRALHRTVLLVGRGRTPS